MHCSNIFARGKDRREGMDPAAVTLESIFLAIQSISSFMQGETRGVSVGRQTERRMDPVPTFWIR